MTMLAASIRVGAGLALMSAAAACSGGHTPKTTPSSQPMRQIWTVNVDGGACYAYAHCGALEPAEHCQHVGTATVTVQIEEVPCLADRPDVQQWDIGQLASDGSCVILSAKCGADLAPCAPPTQPASCLDIAATAFAPSGAAEEAGPPDVAVTAQGNLDKGRAALAAKDAKRARGYFEFALQRFPLATLVHEVELGLVDADALELGAGSPGALDPIASHCAFIAHHPWHPRVVSGEVACQLERLQKRPCVPGDRAAERSCSPVTSSTADAELKKAREAAAKNDRTAARAHLELVMTQAPRSRLSHEAELALIELDLADVPVTDGIGTAPLCAFIEHHPFDPSVTSGAVACRINTLQGRECVAKQIVPTGCRLSYCEDPHGEGRLRSECQGL